MGVVAGVKRRSCIPWVQGKKVVQKSCPTPEMPHNEQRVFWKLRCTNTPAVLPLLGLLGPASAQCKGRNTIRIEHGQASKRSNGRSE